MRKLWHKIVRAIARLYVKRIRRHYSKFWWNVLYKKQMGDPSLAEPYRGLTMREFGEQVSDREKFPYKWDSVKGALDNSFSLKHPEYFFSDLKRGRDCDDFARVWTWWALENGYIAREFVIIEPRHPFKKAHFITVIWDGESYYLANRALYGPFRSEYQALEIMDRWGYTKESFTIQYDYTREKY